MIRPVTIVTFLLAGGSGLYLYQSKHEVQLLDHTIEQTVRKTSELRSQSRLLATEWEMLNNTDRLRQFSDAYLRLQSIAPTQFTSFADLDNRLPAPQAEPHGEDEPKLVPLATETEHPGSTGPVAGWDEVMPIPPVPVSVRPVEGKALERVAAARPAVADSPPQATSVSRLSEPRQTEPRQTEPVAARLADFRREAKVPAAQAPKPVVLAAPPTGPVRPTTPAVATVPDTTMVNAPSPPPSSSAARIAAAGAYGGSLLGMARGAVPPAPRPLPVNATYNAN